MDVRQKKGKKSWQVEEKRSDKRTQLVNYKIEKQHNQ